MNLKKTIFLIQIYFALSYGHRLIAQVPVFEEVSSNCGISNVLEITDLYGNGAAAADFDKDGDIDFYLTTDKGIQDRLYSNDGEGNFTDIAIASGITETISNRAALWFDFNGDQLLDLVVAGENCVSLACENPIHLVLYQQTTDNEFVEVSTEMGLKIGSEYDHISPYAIGGLVAADFNQDEYLDLVLTVWGGGVKLFQNNGGESFTDITTLAGLEMEDKTPWQAMVHDFNQDGLMDIYCNVDFAANKLWINQGDVFEDQVEQYGLANAFNEMGMAMSDYDNDGDLDIYITNITRDFQGQAQYNLLLEQEQEDGKINFKETARSQGVSQSGWDWGTTFIDINNDGRQDLLTTNGWIHVLWGADTSRLWLNTLAGFVDVSDQCGFNDLLSATSLLGFDKDRDGDVDVLQTLKDNYFTNKPLLIYENQLEELPYASNYITVKPRMDGPNHFAIGAVVTMVSEEFLSSRLISAGCSFYGQEPAEAFFGLGAQEAVKEVIVKWPTHEVSVYQNLEINQSTTLAYEVISPPTKLASLRVDEQIELTWQDNSDNETGFILYRSEEPTFKESLEIALEENTNFYTDATAEVNTAYHYKIRAFNAKVLSDDSNLTNVPSNEEVISQEAQTLIYPNPLQNNSLNIKNNLAYVGPVHISIFDLYGREIWSDNTYKTNTIETFQYTLQMPGGMYLLGIQMGTYEYWQKLIMIDN